MRLATAATKTDRVDRSTTYRDGSAYWRHAVMESHSRNLRLEIDEMQQGKGLQKMIVSAIRGQHLDRESKILASETCTCKCSRTTVSSNKDTHATASTTAGLPFKHPKLEQLFLLATDVLPTRCNTIVGFRAVVLCKYDRYWAEVRVGIGLAL